MKYFPLLCLLFLVGNIYSQAPQGSKPKNKFAFKDFKKPSKTRYLRKGADITVSLIEPDGYVTTIEGKLEAVDSVKLTMRFSARRTDYYRIDTANHTSKTYIRVMENKAIYKDENRDTLITLKLKDICNIKHTPNWQNLTMGLIIFVSGAAFVAAPFISIDYADRTFNTPLFFNVFYPSLFTCLVTTLIVTPILYNITTIEVSP